jgi:hypothetical protein
MAEIGFSIHLLLNGLAMACDELHFRNYPGDKHFMGYGFTPMVQPEYLGGTTDWSEILWYHDYSLRGVHFFVNSRLMHLRSQNFLERTNTVSTWNRAPFGRSIAAIAERRNLGAMYFPANMGSWVVVEQKKNVIDFVVIGFVVFFVVLLVVVLLFLSTK